MPSKAKPKIHEFTLVLARRKELTPELADALYEVIDDGTAGSCNGAVTVDFHREATSFEQAVHSAIEDIRKAGFVVASIQTDESRLVEEMNATLSEFATR